MSKVDLGAKLDHTVRQILQGGTLFEGKPDIQSLEVDSDIAELVCEGLAVFARNALDRGASKLHLFCRKIESSKGNLLRLDVKDNGASLPNINVRAAQSPFHELNTQAQLLGGGVASAKGNTMILSVDLAE